MSDQAANPRNAQSPEAGSFWRDLACMAADIAFEVDRQGRFVFLEPERFLGWRAETLLGQPSEQLLSTESPSSVNPFRPGAPIRRRRVQLRTAEGGTATVLVTAAPLLDAQGQDGGTRGLAQDVTRQEARDSSASGDQRRAEALRRILDSIRREASPLRRMQTALDLLLGAIGADGIAIAEIQGKGSPPLARHRSGTAHEVLPAALTLLDTEDPDPVQGFSPDSRPILCCPAVTRFGERVALAAWRAPGALPWSTGELQLAGWVTAILGTVLEHEAIQREMAKQLRNDPLTGLLNRRAFLEEAARRIDRLDREDQTGTLMLLELDDFAPLGRIGLETGDEALCALARLLRTALRPADLVARLGGGSFAAWMDGADDLTTAERAEMLRIQVPSELTRLIGTQGLPLTVSIGIACRRPGRGEELESVLRRGNLALEDARHGGWRVSHDEPA